MNVRLAKKPTSLRVTRAPSLVSPDQFDRLSPEERSEQVSRRLAQNYVPELRYQLLKEVRELLRPEPGFAAGIMTDHRNLSKEVYQLLHDQYLGDGNTQAAEALRAEALTFKNLGQDWATAIE